MPGYYKKASALPISVIQRVILEELVQRHTSQQHHVKRASIILLSSEGRSMTEVCLYLAQAVASSPRTPHLDRSRQALSEATLSDAPRSGTPVTYTAQMVAQIVALSCEDPNACGY